MSQSKCIITFAVTLTGTLIFSNTNPSIGSCGHSGGSALGRAGNNCISSTSRRNLSQQTHMTNRQGSPCLIERPLYTAHECAQMHCNASFALALVFECQVVDAFALAFVFESSAFALVFHLIRMHLIEIKC